MTPAYQVSYKPGDTEFTLTYSPNETMLNPLTTAIKIPKKFESQEQRDMWVQGFMDRAGDPSSSLGKNLLEAYNKKYPAQKPSQQKAIPPQRESSWANLGINALEDIPQFFGDLGTVAQHPMQTLQGLMDIGRSAIHGGMADPQPAQDFRQALMDKSILGAPEIAIQNAMGNETPYPDYEQMFLQDPLYMASDAALPFAAAGPALTKAGLPQAGKVVTNIGKYGDPFTDMALAANKGLEAAAPLAGPLVRGAQNARNWSMDTLGAWSGSGGTPRIIADAYSQGDTATIAAMNDIKKAWKKNPLEAVRMVGQEYSKAYTGWMDQVKRDYGNQLTQFDQYNVGITPTDLESAIAGGVQTRYNIPGLTVDTANRTINIPKVAQGSGIAKDARKAIDTALDNADVFDLLEDMTGNGTVASISQIDQLKSALSDAQYTFPQGSKEQIIIGDIKSSVVNMLDQKLTAAGHTGPSYKQLQSAYAGEKRLAKELNDAFAIVEGDKVNTMKNFDKFWSTVKTDNEVKQALIGKLESVGATKIPIKEQIAALSGMRWTPHGWSGKWSLMALIGAASGGSGAYAAAGIPGIIGTTALISTAVSPRTQAILAKMAGTTERQVANAVKNAREAVRRQTLQYGLRYTGQYATPAGEEDEREQLLQGALNGR